MDLSLEAAKLYENNHQYYKMVEEDGGCKSCVEKRVEAMTNVFTEESFLWLFERIVKHVGCTIEVMDGPVCLIERGETEVFGETVAERSQSAIANTRKLRARWNPSAFKELKVLHGVDPVAELRRVLSQELAIEIVLELTKDKMSLGDEDELVFCPYILPCITPIILSPEDFSVHRGLMMRYAKVVFPKNVEPYQL